MKKSPLRTRKIGSLLLVVVATTSLLTAAFSLYAQEPSVTEATTSTLPVNKIITTVSVGLAGTAGLAITPDSNTLYDGDVGFSAIIPINVSNPQNPVIGNAIATGSGGGITNLVITPSGATLYAVESINPPWVLGSVAVFKNASSPNVAYSETIQGLGEEPGGIAVNPTGTQLYITDFGSASVNVIKTKKNRLVPYQLQAGNGPTGVAFTPNGKYAYIANFDDNTVVVINTATQLLVGAPIKVGSNPQSVVMAPNGKNVYITNQDGTVSVINTATKKVTATINTNSGNNHAYPGSAITPNGNYFYVVAQSSLQVVMVSTATNQIVGTAIPMPNFPSFIVIAPNGKTAYIAANDEIIVVDITTS
ncbi:MAG: beta-propeller fold lactonase family protein [Verrucomicrobia bacterium]|nr:beta-propeller fold lactonase family protein [Verrucomicrobiota bacterium]